MLDELTPCPGPFAALAPALYLMHKGDNFVNSSSCALFGRKQRTVRFLTHDLRFHITLSGYWTARLPNQIAEDCGNINDYCALDDEGRIKKMTLGEKEQAFLEAMSVSII